MKFAEILQLKLDEQDAEIRRKTKLKAIAKDAADKWKDSTPELGKFYCALEYRLTNGQRTQDPHGKPCTPTFASSMTLGDLIEQITKAKPVGRAFQTKNAFSYWVGADGSGPVSEDKYDGLPSNVLEMAGAIAKLLGMDLTKPERDDIAKLLNGYDKNTMANLKAIKAKLDPADPMEAADADKAVEKFAADGNLLAIIGAIVRHSPGTTAEVLSTFVPNLNSVEGKRVYLATCRMGYTFDTAKNDKGERLFGESMVEEWFTEWDDAIGNRVKVKKAETPAPATPEPEATEAVEAPVEELAAA